MKVLINKTIREKLNISNSDAIKIRKELEKDMYQDLASVFVMKEDLFATLVENYRS